jgi:molybdopterin synthase catalytic subunit
MRFAISPHPIATANLREDLDDTRAGGVVCFEGCVRDFNDGRSVQRLEYEAFAPLAEKEGMRILGEAMERFGVLEIVCVHRVGILELGEVAVWVGVASRHRGAAFDACRYVIDEVKARVPIWKKEHYSEGDSGWINCHQESPPVR